MGGGCWWCLGWRLRSGQLTSERGGQRGELGFCIKNERVPTLPSEARVRDARRSVDRLLWVVKSPQWMVRIFMDLSADFGSPNSAESLASERMAASDWLKPKSFEQDRPSRGPAARQHTGCTFYWLPGQNGFRTPKDREKLELKSRLCRYGRPAARRGFKQRG